MHPSATDAVIQGLDAKLPVELHLAIAKELGSEEYFRHRNADYCTKLGELSVVLLSNLVACTMLRIDETHDDEFSCRPKISDSRGGISAQEFMEREATYLQRQRGSPAMCLRIFRDKTEVSDQRLALWLTKATVTGRVLAVPTGTKAAANDSTKSLAREGNAQTFAAFDEAPALNPTIHCYPALNGHRLAFASKDGIALYDSQTDTLFTFRQPNVTSFTLTSKLLAFATRDEFCVIKLEELDAGVKPLHVTKLSLQDYSGWPCWGMTGHGYRIAGFSWTRSAIFLYDGNTNEISYQRLDIKKNVTILVTDTALWIFNYDEESSVPILYIKEMSWSFQLKDAWDVHDSAFDWYYSESTFDMLVQPTGRHHTYQFEHSTAPFARIVLDLDAREVLCSYPNHLIWKNRGYTIDGSISSFDHQFGIKEDLCETLPPLYSGHGDVSDYRVLVNDVLLVYASLYDQYGGISLFSFDRCLRKPSSTQEVEM